MRKTTVLAFCLCFLSTVVAQVDLFASRPKIQKPLSLREAVEIALRESPVLRGAVAELRAAEARLQMARSEKRLQLSANAFTRMGTQSGILNSPPEVMPPATMLLPSGSLVDFNSMLMFPLFTGRRLEALIRRAEALRNATAAQVETIKLDVALEVSVAYLRALFAQELVKVAEAYIRAMEERVRIDREAAKVGRIPEFWVLRSEAELANARQALVNAQRDVEIALAGLKAIMGIHPDSQIALSDELKFEPVKWEREKGMAKALERRPEIVEAMKTVEAETENVRAAKALYSPQINLMAMGEYMSGRMTGGGYLLGISIGLPILDGGRRKAMVAESNAMKEKALQKLEEVKLTVAKEVDTALQELIAAEQNVKTAEAEVKAAEEDLRVAKVRYEVGRSVLVEYLDALFAYIRARTNYARALYEHSVAKAKLQRAIGLLPSVSEVK